MVDHKNAGSETLIHFLLSKLISSCTHESRVPVSDFASKKRDKIISNELIFEGRKGHGTSNGISATEGDKSRSGDWQWRPRFPVNPRSLRLGRSGERMGAEGRVNSGSYDSHSSCPIALLGDRFGNADPYHWISELQRLMEFSPSDGRRVSAFG